MVCSVNRARPNFNIEWVGKTQPQPGTETSPGSGFYRASLPETFTENKTSNMVTHTCRATWNNGTGSGNTVINQDINITVYFAPSGTVKLQTSNPVVATSKSESVYMNCSTDDKGMPPSPFFYYLTKDGDSDFRQNNNHGHFEIARSSVLASGTYRCKVGNQMGNNTNFDRQNLTIEAVVTIERPKHSQKFYPEYNDKAFNISCTASASHPITFTWKQNNVPVPTGDFTPDTVYESGQYSYNLTVASKNTMLWKVLNEDEYTCSNVNYYSGTYICTGTAVAAGIHTSDDSATIDVIVQFPAYFNGHDVMVRKLETTNVEIYCEVCAQPLPTKFEWTFNGSSLPADISRPTIDKLIIPVFKQDHTGLYTCTVTNKPGSNEVSKSFTINLVADDSDAPSTSNNTNTGPHVGSIVAGVLCGLMAIVIIVLVLLLLRERNLNQRSNEASYENTSIPMHRSALSPTQKPDFHNVSVQGTDLIYENENAAGTDQDNTIDEDNGNRTIYEQIEQNTRQETVPGIYESLE
eukprot:GHVU01166536.1.p1 GENE.GHVU01166536.1~~GHVU01166536.1.p1  ORF type:complete len:522 (-),score=38.10 GHVU01166536.1:751-2316(-)